jgi:hypothetical protein
LSFLTYQPDLLDTIFNPQSQYLQDIRDYLVAEIKKIAPEWLDHPSGILGEFWNKDEEFAACHFIWLAIMLKHISESIDHLSQSRLQAKFKALLYANEPKFSEYRAELEVGWYLADKVRSFVIEPLASSGEGVDLSNQTTSPDFAFELGTTVYLEVTTFYVGLLDKWQRTVDTIISVLQSRLLKKGRHLKLYLQLPLQAFEPKQKEKFDTNQMIEYIWRKMRTDSGELTLTHRGKIRWEPYQISVVEASSPFEPQVLDKGMKFIPPDGSWEALLRIKPAQDDASGFIQITPFGVFHSPNHIVDKASFVKEPSFGSLSEEDIRAANEIVLKSLIQKLKVDKRAQYPLRRQKPYLLAMKPGHYRLQGDGLFKLIEEHIWSDDDFNWISGIILFTTRRGFENPDPDNQYTFFLNPKAACPIDESFKEIFQLERRGYQTSDYRAL